jgi:CheY-like chemotaxis protein
MQQKGTPFNGKGIQILVADDDEINLTVIKSMLKHPKIHLTIAKNGEEAVRTHTHQAYDLILMDVSMPVMDGVCATKAIRKKEALEGLRRTPILYLSAHVMDHQKEEFIEAGMDDCLPKPIQKKQLFAAISKLIKASKVDRPARQSMAS